MVFNVLHFQRAGLNFCSLVATLRCHTFQGRFVGLGWRHDVRRRKKRWEHMDVEGKKMDMDMRRISFVA